MATTATAQREDFDLQAWITAVEAAESAGFLTSPEGLRQPLLQAPLHCPDPQPVMMVAFLHKLAVVTAPQSHFVDAYAVALDPDAYEWLSSEETLVDPDDLPSALTTLDLSADHDVSDGVPLDFDALKGLLDRAGDTRGFIVLELVETELNYTRQLRMAQSLYRNGLVGIVPAKPLNLIFRGM